MSNEPEKFDKDRILHINFNQDQGIITIIQKNIFLGCFAVGTESGFRVYNTFPLKETFSRGKICIKCSHLFQLSRIILDLGSGIGYLEMFYRSNILAFVSGGTSPKKSLDKVWIWDDNQNKVLAEINFKSQEVKSVKLRPNK